MLKIRLWVLAGAALVFAGCETARVAERDPVTVDAVYPPTMIEASFLSDGARLNALVYLADGAGPHPGVLLLHGYPGNEKNLDVAQYLRRDGWNVFFFHYRGAWGSEGEFSFVNAADDVGAALAHMRENAGAYRLDPDRIAIVGHSMGGQMTLAGAANDPGVKCAVTLAAAPVEPDPQSPPDEETLDAVRAYADGLIMLRGHDGSNVIEQDAAFAQRFPLARLTEKLGGKKLLMIGAEKDVAVPIGEHYRYAEAFGANPGIDLSTEVYDTDHGFATHRIAISRRIADWLDAGCR
ncbi:MAG: alpha/beta fold hydrolase [Parvularculaceae bacterium]|nr:alpha/beta fold hydrolase [Parvularculaceae bacterium]